jgi:cell wall-associated NlpC family hydrolase
MGPTPDLGGTVPYTGATGDGPVQALTTFDGVVSTSGWPNAGVGTKVRGTAPSQKPDGKTVHPVLPAYRAGYTPLRAEVAVDAALEKLGSPYVWDAAGPNTFDCSGLMLWAWAHAGIPLTHFTGDQVHEGVAVAPNELLPGDLLLFGSTLHHVGMYLGAGYMIDAPNTGDYVKVQLVSDDGDFAVAVRP